MKTLRILPLPCLLRLLLFSACSEDTAAPPAATEAAAVVPVACSPFRAGHATGEVQLVWRGGSGALHREVTADGITWKWFVADDPDLPSIADLTAWPHLCRKTITGGNRVVHATGDVEARRQAESD